MDQVARENFQPDGPSLVPSPGRKRKEGPIPTIHAHAPTTVLNLILCMEKKFFYFEKCALF